MKQLIILICFLSFGALASDKSSAIMQSILDQYIDNDHPGCSVAYGNASNTFYLSKGVEQVATKKLITEHTRFLTASISKQFTAHLALLLAEKEKLNLNSTLEYVIPEVGVANRITPLQLINHTSGIADHWTVFEFQGKSLSDRYWQSDALRLIKNNTFLEFEPGTEYSYSNGGYAALTQTIERVSGSSLNKLISNYVFDELGINAQYLDSPNTMPAKLVHGHIKDRDGRFKYKAFDSYIYGPGNLMITTKELAAWARYLNTYLLKNGNDIASSGLTNFNYMAGLFVDKDENGTTYYHHGGYYEHAAQDIVLIPSRNEFAAVLCNRSDFRPAKITRGILNETKSLVKKQNIVNNIKKVKAIQSGFYANKNKTKSAFFFQEEGEYYYYGDLVGSPKKLKRLSNELWVAELSASNVFIELTDSETIIARNEQKEYELQLVANQKDIKDRIEDTVFKNDLVGNIRVTLGETNSIEFLSGLGKFSLTCFEGNVCFGEYGYLVLDWQAPSTIILSTHDIENLKFNRQSQ